MTGERELLAESAPRFFAPPPSGPLWTQAQVLAAVVRASERAVAQTVALLAEYLERNGRRAEAEVLRRLRPEDITACLDLAETVSETKGRGPREEVDAA